MSVVVFTGPTISPADVRRVIEAECMAPAAQGDVYRAALRRPNAIGIIDGFFESVPSVWHKEILWAMAQGIHVFGSASMGALRAAELAPFGMIGIGAIFEAFRDGVLEDDDEVAVAHGPTEDTYSRRSDAMVNIRATLEKARAGGVLRAASHDALLRIAKSLYYPDRCWAHVLEVARAEGVSAGELDLFQRWLPGGAVDLKRQDALAMLQAMRDFLAGNPGPAKVSYVFEETMYWEEFIRASHETGPASHGPADTMVLNELAADPEELMRAQSAALGWLLASERGRAEGCPPEAVALLEASREFCVRHNLTSPGEMAEWQRQNECAGEDLERLLEGRASLLGATHRAPSALRTALLQYLRWTGNYATLLNRARRA